MQINTDNQKEAFKLTMRFLGKEQRVNRRKMCKVLTKGNEPYSRSQDASEFLKNLVNSDQFPIERSENCLVRTDLKEVVN